MNKDFEDDDFEDNFTNLKENITIGTAQRRGRKCYTQVKNIPDIFDYDRILKFWKKNFKCGGSIKKDEETGKLFVEVAGDHRDEISKFLTYMGICSSENIRIQGKDNL